MFGREPRIVSVKDLLSRARAGLALQALYKAHPKPLNMTDIMQATGYFSEEATSLVEDLRAEWGLVTVRKHARGSVQVKEIQLTALGLEVAPLYVKIDGAMKRAGKSPSES